VEHHSIENTFAGPVLGGFMATLHHVDLTHPTGAQVVLSETWNVRVFAIEPFVWDLESRQQAVADALTISRYDYGGLAVRGSAEWTKARSCEFLTSLGDGRIHGNHSRPDWVAMFGRLKGEQVAICALGHPRNFRAPQYVRLHPTLPYFCFAPMVSEAFSIQQDSPHSSSYRFLVADVPPRSSTVDKYWQDYATPVTTTWKLNGRSISH
jgi:hypothetical protein